jgi:hypothetical protein
VGYLSVSPTAAVVSKDAYAGSTYFCFSSLGLPLTLVPDAFSNGAEMSALIATVVIFAIALTL